MTYATTFEEYFGNKEQIDRILNDDRFTKDGIYLYCDGEDKDRLEEEYDLDFVTLEEILDDEEVEW